MITPAQIALLEALPALVWTTDARGRLAHVNGRYASHVGRPGADIVATGDLDLHPDDLAVVGPAFCAAVARREAFEQEGRLRRADGTYRRHVLRAGPLLDERGLLTGYVGTCSEAASRAEAEAEAELADARQSQELLSRTVRARTVELDALHERLRMLAGIVASSADGIMSFDLAGTVTSWNEGAERMYGWRADEVLGRSIFDADLYLPPDRHQQARENLARIGAVGRIEPFESRHRRRDGSAMDVAISLAAVSDAEGATVGCSVIARDISASKAADARLRASLAEKEVLLMEVHHRVKNNLQVICSLLSLQATQVRDPGLLGVLADMENRVRSIAMAHEKLYQAPDLARIDLGAHVRDVVLGLARAYEGASHRQRPRVDLDLAEAWVGVDTAIPCGLIVNELVTNALKYAFPERSGTIRVALRSVGERYHLLVADDGVGQPEGLPLRKGSLGLRLVDALVRQLGGVVLRSTQPGTSVEIRFAVRRTRRTLELRTA